MSRISIAYIERRDDSEAEAELISAEYVQDVRQALESCGHVVSLLELSGPLPEVMGRLREDDSELIFNLAEGRNGPWREAVYPMMYEHLRKAYTGAGPVTLAMALDKRLTEEALAAQGVPVPKGALLTREHHQIPADLRFPLLAKPNYEGSSKGIHADSILHDIDHAQHHIRHMLEQFPDGVDVEEFIPGRELQVGYLAQKPRPFTAAVEYVFPEGHAGLMDYATKQGDGAGIETICPARLSPKELDAVQDVTRRAVEALGVRDFGRVDLRLREDGTPVVIEVNPLAGLRRISPFIIGAKADGLSYAETLDLIVQSALRRERVEEVTA